MRHPIKKMRFLSLALLFGIGGCFNYSEPDCSFSCGTGTASEQCPGNYECRTDGYCHKVGTPQTESCGYSDASTVTDMSAVAQPDAADDGSTPSMPSPDQSIAD